MRKKDTKLKSMSPTRGEKKSDDFTRKIEPLEGGLVREMIRCGRANCKCANGSPHGPYYYRVWMLRGIRYKSYVKKADFDRIKTGIEAFQTKKRERAEIKTILRENRETRRYINAILRLRGF